MAEKELFVDSSKMYRLFEDSRGDLFLGVLVGGIGMYELVFGLSAREKSMYAMFGKDYLDALSAVAAKHACRFERRRATPQ